MVKQRMKKASVASLEKLLQDFKELGGKIMACDMTMQIMGIARGPAPGPDRRALRGGRLHPRSQRLGHNPVYIEPKGTMRHLYFDRTVRL